MAKIKTESGFECEIDLEKIKNYELVEALAELEENALTLPKVVNMIFGKEQTGKLKDHLRTEDGVVPVEKMMNEIKEIFESSQAVKN